MDRPKRLSVEVAEEKRKAYKLQAFKEGKTIKKWVVETLDRAVKKGV